MPTFDRPDVLGLSPRSQPRCGGIGVPSSAAPEAGARRIQWGGLLVGQNSPIHSGCLRSLPPHGVSEHNGTLTSRATRGGAPQRRGRSRERRTVEILSKGEPEPAKLADEGLGENGLGDKGLGDIGLDDDIVRSRYELDRLIGRGGFITGACSSS